MPDHMCLSIPPKFSVAHTIGFLKGKSAVRIHRQLLKERRMTGLHFWAAGEGAVSPVTPFPVSSCGSVVIPGELWSAGRRSA